jgi:PAS domain S-box-containing protein
MDKNINILLIESNRADARALNDMLLKTYFSSAFVSVVTSLEEAKKKLAETLFALILLDLNLPDSNGLESLIHIRKEFSDPAIIVLTGYDDEEIGLEAVRMGAQDYLIKGNTEFKILEKAIRYSIERNNVILERNQAQLKLRLQASILENVLDSIIVTDNSGKIVYWNEGSSLLFGYAESEMIGRSTKRLYPKPFSIKDIHLPEEILSKGHEHSGEFKAKRKDGSTIWIDLKITRMKSANGDPVGYIGVGKNITERKHIQEAYKALAEYSIQGFVIIKDGTILFANEQMSKITGYDLDTLKSFSKENFLAMVHPDDLEIVLNPTFHQESFFPKEGVNFSNYEFRLIQKNGNIRWIYNVVTKIEYLGSPAIQSVVMDITDKKLSEENLKASKKDLETFVYKATHDLKGPLSSIIGLAHVANMSISDATALNYIRMIGDSTGKLDKTLNRLIEAMMTKNKELNVEQIDFKDLLKNTISQLKYLPGYNRISFTTSVEEGVCFYSDVAPLRSILQNLIENSIKYQNYAISKPSVFIQVKSVPEGVEILIKDNGIGILEEIHDKIFDMFYRGHEESNGSGLGLYIVKSAVENLKGRIKLNNQVQEGCCFVIILKSIKETELA